MTQQSRIQATAGPAKARLEGLLLEGLTSGKSKAVDKTFWADLRAEAQRLVAERSATGKKK